MAFSLPAKTNIKYPPESLRAFHVFGYEYVDDLNFLHEPSQHVPDAYDCEDYIREAKAKFVEAGWHGDGEIKLIWIPPFLLPPTDDNDHMGVLVWFVKQLEDGISWILSPIELTIY
jgi:hypothetical protein